MKSPALKHQVQVERDDNHITILKMNTKAKSDSSRIWYDKENNYKKIKNNNYKKKKKKEKPNQLP